MLVLTERLAIEEGVAAHAILALTAEERQRSRHRFDRPEGSFYLSLPRGTVLRDGDVLRSETGTEIVRVIAKPEPVLAVTATRHLDLLRAAYHLGNRHVALEIRSDVLLLSPDAVLQEMLVGLGLQVVEDVCPFQPEAGAYRHSH